MRILIVEDDPILLDGLVFSLKLCGWAVDDVSSCGDASDALATAKFDAVVPDVMLADGSGVDLLAEIRKTETGRPSSCSPH